MENGKPTTRHPRQERKDLTDMAIAWIALNSINGLGPVKFGRLLERYGSPEAVFESSADEMVREGLLTAALAEKFKPSELMDNAQRELERAYRMGVEVITLVDKRYPPYLREIFAPPPLIFVRGDPAVLSRHSVAVVGARSPTAYGRAAAAKIVRELVEERFVIVSGLARGIDTEAHTAALNHGGTTVAVLGSGLDMVYPKSNEALCERIVANGAVVSEFSLGTNPEACNFPRRNRIISGCSAAAVVVEAGGKSGSLITARYALQQGREVCAVPGPINSAMSAGTFELLRDGATPVRSGHELAESLVTVSNPALAQADASPQKQLDDTVFTETERQVFGGLSEVPRSIDVIAEVNGMPMSELFVTLLNLELRGLVKQYSGQQFVKV